MKIAVCGSAPSSRMFAPFGDPSWEIWACSPQNYDFPRVDAWFELHNLDRKWRPDNVLYTEKLIQHPRVYIAKPDPRLPNGILFNPQRFLDRYGEDFFTSSLAWMLAFAIEQAPEAIGIWGVDMSATDEYDYQRPGIKFFMREAAKAGIQVMVPPQSDLHEPMPLYAFQEHWPMFEKMNQSRKELEKRISAAKKLEDQKRDEVLLLTGARDYSLYIKNTYIRGPDFWNQIEAKKEETEPSVVADEAV